MLRSAKSLLTAPFYRPYISMNDIAAVDHDVLALQERGARRREVQREIGDLPGLADAASWHILLDALACDLRVPHERRHRRDRSRADRVHDDVLTPELVGHRLRQVYERRLGEPVERALRIG